MSSLCLRGVGFCSAVILAGVAVNQAAGHHGSGIVVAAGGTVYFSEAAGSQDRSDRHRHDARGRQRVMPSAANPIRERTQVP